MAPERVVSGKNLNMVTAELSGFPDNVWMRNAVLKGASGGATKERADYFGAMVAWGSQHYLGRKVSMVREVTAITGVDEGKRELLLDKFSTSIVEASSLPGDQGKTNYLAGIRQAETVADVENALGRCPPLVGLGERVFYHLVAEDAQIQLEAYQNDVATRGKIFALDVLNRNIDTLTKSGIVKDPKKLSRLSEFRNLVEDQFVAEVGPKIVLIPDYFGQIVANNGISDKYVLARMGEVRTMLENSDINDPMDRDALKKNVEAMAERLFKAKKPDPQEIKIARRILGQMVGVLGNVLDYGSENTTNVNRGGSEGNRDFDLNNPAVGQWLRALAESQGRQADYYERKGRLDKDVEIMSLKELLTAYLTIKAPRERQPQLWEYDVPKWMNGTSVEQWRNILSLADGFLGAIYTKRRDSEYKTQPKMVKEKILTMMSLSEEDFKLLYEHPVLNIRGVMCEISREMLVPKIVSGTIEGKGMVTGKTYVFQTEPDPDKPGKFRYRSEFVRQYVDNEGIFKAGLEVGGVVKIKGLAHRLVEQRIVPNIEAAKLAVSFAMDILELGGVFSGADELRMLGDESDAVRLVQNPAAKFLSKIGGGERWGGSLGNYAVMVTGNEKDAANLLQSMGVVPQLLAGSFLDHLGWMDKIYNNEKIDLKNKTNDLYFGWRKDEIMAACDFWLTLNGKVPLVFKKLDETDAQITEWAGDPYNAIKTLRENKVTVLTTNNVVGAIGASTNLWPFKNKALYLRINSMAEAFKVRDTYVRVGKEIVRSLALNTVERDFIEKKFNLNFVGGSRLGSYMSGYDLEITFGRK